MTSHAALSPAGWGKCCVVGAGRSASTSRRGRLTVGETVLRRATSSPSTHEGRGLRGHAALVVIDPEKNRELADFLAWCDGIRSLRRAPRTPTAGGRGPGAALRGQGIGLCRTEHMFFGEERIKAMREMISPVTLEERERAIIGLLPFQKQDFKAILKEMAGPAGDHPAARPAACTSSFRM